MNNATGGLTECLDDEAMIAAERDTHCSRRRSLALPYGYAPRSSRVSTKAWSTG